MNNKRPLLTIVIPVYNGGEDLKLAFQSILKQSFKDWELLLIDDGSTDNAIHYLGEIIDTRVRIIRDGENKGLAKRLNEAVELAQGIYFARMDQDDISHPDRFQEQIKFISKANNIDLVGSSCVTIDEDNKLTGSLPYAIEHEEICKNPWQGFYLPHPTWLAKLEWFKENPYKIPGPYCCEDQELLLRTHINSKFHTLPQKLLAYRLRRCTPWRKMWRTRKTLFNEQAEYFSSKNQHLLITKSFLTFLIKTLHDIFKKIIKNEKPPMLKKILISDKKEWEQIVNNLNNTINPPKS